VVLSHDSSGNLLRVSSAAIVVLRSYDAMNRMTMMDIPVLNRQIYYEYDGDGRRQSRMLLNTTDQSFELTQYFYDSAGRLSEIQEENSSTNFAYTTAGRLSQITYPNSVIRSQIWDEFGRLASIEYSLDNTTLMTQAFEYDGDGRRIKEHTQEGTTTFTYDSRGKLVSVRYSDGTSSLYDWYPESDLRLSATNPQGETKRFLFDQESEFVTFSETNTPILTITSIPNTYDERLFMRTPDGELTTWLTVHLQSVRGTITDTSNQTPEQTFAYYAFGGLRDGDPLANLDFGYTGRTLDLPANLYYYRGRFMDSCNGTFTQVDPMQDGNNWYSYVNGDPINNSDPSGYVAPAAGAAAGGAVGGPIGFFVGGFFAGYAAYRVGDELGKALKPSSCDQAATKRIRCLKAAFEKGQQARRICATIPNTPENRDRILRCLNVAKALEVKAIQDCDKKFPPKR
jgi:RHS repeat-associated protein